MEDREMRLEVTQRELDEVGVEIVNVQGKTEEFKRFCIEPTDKAVEFFTQLLKELKALHRCRPTSAT